MSIEYSNISHAEEIEIYEPTVFEGAEDKKKSKQILFWYLEKKVRMRSQKTLQDSGANHYYYKVICKKICGDPTPDCE